jgi:hypothetical protein
MKKYWFYLEPLTSPTPKMAYAIFGSPTRHPIQDKKTALIKNGILKVIG